MADFQFLQNPINKKWTILAPRRATRPDVSVQVKPTCPFCPGSEETEHELYRIGGENNDQNWLVRVLENKFPFTPIHEVIVHSPDHHKNFDELPLDQNELILKAYRQRFNTHRNNGQVYMFHNRGEQAGESLPHPHTQLTVVPNTTKLDISPVGNLEEQEFYTAEGFELYCPQTSEWPDEVWIVPQKRDTYFGDITDEEIKSLAFVLSRLIQVLDMRHGHEFPFNFYISPEKDWYLRLFPRQKSLGGFEVGTGIIINTQDPKETLEFLKEHFENPDKEKITKKHPASYTKHV